MATADQCVVLNNKQSIGLIELRERLFQIVDKWDNDVAKALWDEDGWFVGVGYFGAPTISGPALGQFQLSTDERGTDGWGNLINMNEVVSFPGPHTFENADGVDYKIGLMSVRIPTVIKTSLETGFAQYTAELEVVGRKGEPDDGKVVDNGTNITFSVDGITEAGVSNAGRQVVVYMKDPLSPSEAIAIETCTVFWDAGENKITTTGLLGQTAAITVASYYEVVLLGPWVSRNTDLSVEPGVLYVGEVQGDDTNPPSVFDNEGVTIMIPIPDLWNVLEYGPNGDLKIAVKQHPSDSGVPQISVKNDFANIKVFQVDGLGQISILAPDTGVLKFKVDANGNITECGGQFQSSTGVIKFNDVNTGGFIPLSETGQSGLPLDLQSKTIIGIAEGANTKNLISTQVIEGCEVTHDSLLDISIAAGEIFYKGFRHEVEGPTILGLPDSATRYIRYNILGMSFSVVSTHPGDTDAPETYLAKVVTAGGTVTKIVDLRRRAARIDRRVDILVGDLDGGSYQDHIPHFATLGEAFDAINVWANEATVKLGGPYRIQVIGDCTESVTPLVVPVDGLEVWASRGRRTSPPIGPRIKWDGDISGNNELFDLNGKKRLRFHGLDMEWTGAAPAGGVGTPSRLCFVNRGGPVDDLMVRDCRGYGGDGFFVYSGANSQANATFVGCEGESQGTCGIVWIDASVGSGKIRVIDCDFFQSGNNYTTNDYGIYLAGWEDAFVRGCTAEGFVDVAMNFGLCGLDVRGNSAAGDSHGIHIQIGCTGAVSGNRIVTTGGDGIRCEAAKMRITENTINDADNHGININGVEDCYVAGNHITSAGESGVYVGGTKATLLGNHIVNPADYGVYIPTSAGADCKVLKNHITGSGSHGIFFNNASHCECNGNRIYSAGGYGIRAVSSNSIVGKNHVLNSTNTAIMVQSTEIQVVNNFINKPSGVAIALESASGCSVLGNTIKSALVNALTVDANSSKPVVSNNHLNGGNIYVLGVYPIVNGNHTDGGDITLANSATQKGLVIGNNLRNGTGGAVGSITANANDDVAHNML